MICIIPGTEYRTSIAKVDIEKGKLRFTGK